MQRWLNILQQGLCICSLRCLLIASLTFFLMKLIPGSPYAGAAKLSPAQIELMNEQYGLNDPVPVQYAKYMFGFVKR